MNLGRLVRNIRPAPLGAFVASATGLNRRRVVPYRGFSLFIDPTTNMGQGVLGGDYESGLRETLERYLRPGGVFIDLGANEGLFSVMGSRLVGETGTVIAVEPQDRLQSVLRRNFELNDCHNCRIVHAIISDHVGDDGEIYLSAATITGSSSMFKRNRYAQRVQPVRVLTLEALLDQEGLEQVDLLKIDVEGAEYDVLMSQQRVLSSGRIRIVNVDYHHSILEGRGLSFAPMHKLLTDCGYTRLSPTSDVYVWRDAI